MAPRNHRWLTIRRDGTTAAPGVEREVVYVVLTDEGEQRTLTPQEFAEKYGWQNDPDKVRLFQ